MAIPASGVTFVVLNYNGRELLPVVLASIFGQTVEGFKTVVIDDASADDSVAYLAAEWPLVEVVASERNMGISAAMARAVSIARTPYLALLNNDLELDPRWLAEMLSAMAEHPHAAAADGKMLSFHDRTVLDGAGDEMQRNGYPRRRGGGERDRGQYEQPGEVFSATGGAALYRREALDRVGPFDADLGAYYEDVDWGFRERLLGLRTRYVPKAVCFHMGSATTSREPGRYASLIVRNQMLVMVKDFPAALLLFHLPRILLFQAKWLVFNSLHGLGAAHIRGLRQAAGELPATLRKRRAIQRARTAGLLEIERALS